MGVYEDIKELVRYVELNNGLTKEHHKITERALEKVLGCNGFSLEVI